MGIMLHDAMVIVAYERVEIERARKMARKFCIPGTVTECSPRISNGLRSFAVLPDGSKEGWETSTEADDGREKLCAWLAEQNRKGPIYEWVEVRFGPDIENAEATQGGFVR